MPYSTSVTADILVCCISDASTRGCSVGTIQTWPELADGVKSGFDGRASTSPDEEQSERTRIVYDGLHRRARNEHRGTTDKTEEAVDG